ncbi:hypothetical protein DPMN_084499 [Dreissena polymorpha]|uniref:Uncharacterized protein n=1 Tax=Dreissena polymorpha TaxID=45954 RepID=A0A9D4BJF6_DREPO|nr:hypothetical protein DPMN_084499 [Dreissena polymorpha]
MRDPSGHTSLPSFVPLAHILGEISENSRSHYRVTGPIRVRSRRLRAIFTGNDGTETLARTGRMRDLSGHTSLPSFVALARLLGEISETSGSHYRVTGPIRAR